jgi:hypothetical protein
MASEFDKKHTMMKDEKTNNKIQELEASLFIANRKILQLEHDSTTLGENTIVVCKCKQHKFNGMEEDNTGRKIIYKVTFCTWCKVSNWCRKLCCISNHICCCKSVC